MVVIYRRPAKFPWILKTNCTFDNGGIQYDIKLFSTKESVEIYLEKTLTKQPFCQLRTDQYNEQDYWIDITMRIWKDMGKSSLCYPVLTSSTPIISKSATPSKLLFFFSNENPEHFAKFNMTEEMEMFKDIQTFEVTDI